ncbi:hypothetical protein BVC80_9099g143 [Macleaya cordata]|uniref:Exocyst component Exo84 C-terminal domain-containing protein n=1 Tax=Macleaya cordata TaxID=56857 RepID=A0A200PVV0_MACCD|nr:hypothetical protein BVC80_9099g143 [Macleaya cordata]
MDSTRRFRFRDPENSDSTSDEFSESSIDESKLESMTGKGIKRLCSELLELKKASDEDYHRNIYSNYSTFVRIFEEVGTMENELIQLKQHVLTQRKLVKDLMDGIHIEMLSEESIESILEESVDVEQSHVSKLEAPTKAISETLDILLSEHRLDEALAILEIGLRPLKIIQLEEDPPLQVLASYNSAISERKSRLADQFAIVASHPRVAAPEFQKALAGLQRLGESQRATQLLLKFYHSRLVNGIYDLQCSKQFLHGIYFMELAKFVFSVISQGARSFEVLFGEKSPYASEFIQWAREEMEVFVLCFDKYVKSISEINGGLSTAVEAVQIAFSFCSLLEAQSIMLQPCLVKLMRPCMEEVLKMHIDHFKKVIGIFTATDDWVLGKYLISGILKEKASPIIIGHELEYCLLTNSGRKFASMLQAVMKEVSPLVILQMETSILNGLTDLFREYIEILIRSIPSKTNILEKGDSRIIFAQTLSQQLSVLANALALVDIFSRTARSIFKNIDNFDDQPINATGIQWKELDNWMVSIQQMAGQVRVYFCQQFVYRVMSLEGGSRLCPETYFDEQHDTDTVQDLMPSVAFQVLFQELRELEKIGKEVFAVEVWQVEDLMRELMETVFVWLSNSQDFWSAIEDRSIVEVQQSRGFEQMNLIAVVQMPPCDKHHFVVDMHFLVEISRFGGYFSENMVDASLTLIYRMEPAFVYAGWDPNRDVLTDEWATNAANEAISKLLGTEKLKSSRVEEPSRTTFEEDPESGNSSAVRMDQDTKKLGVTPSDEAISKQQVTEKIKVEEPSRTSEEVPGSENSSDSVEEDRSSIEDSVELDNGLAENESKDYMIDQEIQKLGVSPSDEGTSKQQESEELKSAAVEEPSRTSEEDPERYRFENSSDFFEDARSSMEDSVELENEVAVNVSKTVIMDQENHKFGEGVTEKIKVEEEPSRTCKEEDPARNRFGNSSDSVGEEDVRNSVEDYVELDINRLAVDVLKAIIMDQEMHNSGLTSSKETIVDNEHEADGNNDENEDAQSHTRHEIYEDDDEDAQSYTGHGVDEDDAEDAQSYTGRLVCFKEDFGAANAAIPKSEEIEKTPVPNAGTIEEV